MSNDYEVKILKENEKKKIFLWQERKDFKKNFNSFTKYNRQASEALVDKKEVLGLKGVNTFDDLVFESMKYLEVDGICVGPRIIHTTLQSIQTNQIIK